jgi:hypothetical protein
MKSRVPERSAESGFALIVAIIALVLLTFLGLTITLSTSTETQIAKNYSWSRQAYFNAQAGAEVARNLLRTVTPDWAAVLPVARTYAQMGPATGTPPGSAPLPGTWLNSVARGATANARDWEGAMCDRVGGDTTQWGKNGIGYGQVLTVNGTTLDYVTTFQGHSLNGAFTVWVRRLTSWDAGGKMRDCAPPVQWGTCPTAPDSELIMTVEGVAPFTQTAIGLTPALRQGQAVSVLEFDVTGSGVARTSCGEYGQSGGGAGGAGFAQCMFIQGGGVPGATEVGTTVR